MAARLSRTPPIPESVLVAPDSFKGTFAAAEVAAAVGRGLQDGGRPAELCPVADGGEGTLDALVMALGGEVHEAAGTDPLGRSIEARFALSGTIGIVETAAASGLGLVAPRDRDAFAADTVGTGELIAAAVW